MKVMFMLAALLGFSTFLPQQKTQDYGLPELHRIKTITLSPAYSCRSLEDFHHGYENTALFLSDYSRHRSPELLFNGACGGVDDFESMLGGDEMSLIADLGEIPLEKLTAHLAFNTSNVHSFDLYSKFAERVKVQPNHTYAVVINQGDIRGLFLFTVTTYIPNKKVDLRYVVEEYQIFRHVTQSPGFRWETEDSGF